MEGTYLCCILFIRSKALDPSHTKERGFHRVSISGGRDHWETHQQLPATLQHAEGNRGEIKEKKEMPKEEDEEGMGKKK